MKSQIKRFSKSTMSVILAFCMLVSCMMVGIIATDAAYAEDEAVGTTVPNNTTFYLDVTNFDGDYDTGNYYMSLSGNGSTTANKSSTSGAGNYVPKNDTSWVKMEHLVANIYQGTTTAQNTNGMISFWSKNGSSYNNIWEMDVSLGNAYESGKNLFTISSGFTSHSDRRASCFSGTWSAYTPGQAMHGDCPANVVNGTDIMFYIRGYAGENKIGNSSKQQPADATFKTVHNDDGYATVKVAKTLAGSYQYITNNPSNWAGDLNSDIGASSGGNLHIGRGNSSTTPAKTATTTVTPSTISTGTASVTIGTTCNSTTGVYNSLDLYYQYYLDDTFVSYSEKSAKTSEQTFILDTSSLSTGEHTLKTILTDGNIFYIADTDTITVSSTPRIDTFTINDAASATLNIGETATLASTKSNSTNSVSYSVTSGSDVVSISNTTTVKALKPGSATITASLTGATSKTVTVTVNTPTLNLSYSPDAIVIGGKTASPTVSLGTGNNASATISSEAYSKTGSAGSINASSGVVTSSASTTGAVSVTVTATVSYNGVSYSSATGTATVNVYNHPNVHLVGGFMTGGWTAGDGNKMTYNATDDCYYIEKDLNSTYSYPQNGDWGFGVTVDRGGTQTFYNNAGTMTSSNCTDWHFETNKQNCGITPTLTGTYIFKVTLNSYNADPLVSLLYPNTISYDANGHGDAPESEVVKYNGKATEPKTPTETGWTFGGWYKEAGCANVWDFSTDTVTEDKTLYAKWTQNSHSITYTTGVNYSYSNNLTTSAHYGDIINFNVTAANGYRIVSVKYNDGSDHTITPSNGSYSFEMPDADVTISVTTIKTYTVTLTADTGFASRQYKLGSSGTYQSYTSGTTLTVDTGTDVYFKVTYSNGYEYSTNSGLTVVTANTEFRTGAISANKTVTLTAKKTDYKISTAISPNYGTLKLYSDPECNTELTKKSFSGTQYYSAQYGDTFYAKYESPSGGAYALNSFTVTGTDTSNTNISGNIGTFTMGYANATITANLKATTPSFNGTWLGMEVYAKESFTYANTGGGTVTPSGCTFTYKFNNGSYQNSSTFTAPETPGPYTLTIKASNKPSGIDTAATATRDVTITVKYRENTIKYYVDMHGNPVKERANLNNPANENIEVAITDSTGETVKTNTAGNQCKTNLAQQQNSKVYMGTIATPLIKSGSSMYRELYIRVKFTYYDEDADEDVTVTKVTSIPGNLVGNLDPTSNGSAKDEVWLEAVNESSQTLNISFDTTFDPATGSTPKVATGYRRIYLAKPYGWQNDNPDKWTNIGVYHWGDYDDIGWNYGISMTYLGYGKLPDADENSTDIYHYYYVDLPKYVESDGETVSTAADGYKVQNIIFQGWGSNTSNGNSPQAQTGNIEEIPDSANFYILSKDGNAFKGTKSDADVVIPTYARHAYDVKMNVGETGVSIAPTNTGEKVTYTSSDPSKVTVNDDGVITAVASTANLTDDKVTVTVKVYGSIGAKISDTTNGGGGAANGADAVIYTVDISVHDPSVFNGFNVMSLESQTYTVSVPMIKDNEIVSENGDQPGYFDFTSDDMLFTVSGLLGVNTSTSSAIITEISQYNVDGIENKPIAFTVKYAKANDSFSGYSGIGIVGNVVTKSIAHTTTGNRYGLKNWLLSDNTNPNYTISKAINNGTETVTTLGIVFSDSSLTYRAKFESYQYVDVTFTFTYDEYVPKVVDGMIQYPYDTTWAAENGSHTTKTVTVSNYEVRGKTADNVAASDLVAPATAAIDVMPENNYYDYSIAESNITIPDADRNANAYTASAAVAMSHSVKYYHVYVNGTEVRNPDTASLSGADRYGYTYQAYSEPTVDTASNWYAVDALATTSTENAPLLAAGTTSYKFRVKGNTYLRTATGSALHGSDFLRSEVDFSHYEVTHKGSTSETMKEYLLQNFYIADFFSPAEVLSDRRNSTNTGYLPYDDAQFVGGGVVYYSMNGATENNQGTPFANAVSSGYVDGSTGKINEAAIKEMLKSNIEARYSKDNIAGVVGEEDAMKAAYGTEIEATKNVEGGFNTGIIYRYLPLNQYKRYGSDEKTVDITLTNNANIVNYTLTTKDQSSGLWSNSSSVTSDTDTEIANGKRTIRFTNNQNWNAVFVHYWGGATASNWPRIRMTDKGNGVFEAVIPGDATYIVFDDGCNMPATDENGEYTLEYEVNTNTFRYSNTLHSYQYVYASGNENKETNAGKNMRLYSYYVYSYVAYNQETNVPETKYEIVLSDNYSDASTYWNGNTGN